MVLSFRDLYPHSLECILSVIWSISTSLAFDPILVQKQGGGVRESDFHADLALEFSVFWDIFLYVSNLF